MEWAGDWKYFFEIFLRNIESIVFNDNIPIVDCPIDF